VGWVRRLLTRFQPGNPSTLPGPSDLIPDGSPSTYALTAMYARGWNDPTVVDGLRLMTRGAMDRANAGRRP